MGFTGRGMAMHGVATIALFGPLLSLKKRPYKWLLLAIGDSVSPPLKNCVPQYIGLLHL
jgi:hypothetical protein